MFLTIIALLTVGQMFLEYQVVKALHLEEISKRFILLNLGMSICLSLLFGFLFPAAGMTIAAAGLLSTILSQPMYEVVEWYETRAKPSIANVQGVYSEHKSGIRQTIKDFLKFLYYVMRVVTFPFRVIRSIMLAYEQMKGALDVRRASHSSP